MPKTMKRCTMCGTERDPGQSYCPACGAAAFSYVEIPDEAPVPETETSVPPAPQEQPYSPAPGPIYDGVPVVGEPAFTASEPVPDKHENVVAGIGGAILFSLGGVLLYVLLYQIGFVASISAFVTFALATFGYGLLCGNKKTTSLPSVITPIVVTFIMIILSVFLGIGIAIFIELKKEGYQVTILDVMKAIPNLLKDKDLRGEFIKDMLFALLFGALGTVGSIIRSVSARKAAKKTQ